MATAFKQVADNASSLVTTNGLNNTDTTVSFEVEPGDGEKFPDPGNGFYITAWNADYTDPGDDPFRRMGVCTARDVDELTVTWDTAPGQAMAGRPRVALLVVSQLFEDLYEAVTTAEAAIEEGALPSRAVSFTVSPAGVPGDYVCDGTADNVQIQQAIDDASAAGGGVVYLRWGIYNLIARLLIPDNISLVGEHQFGTILRMGAGLNTTVVGNSDTTLGQDDISIRNLTIDQQGATQSSGGGCSFTGLRGSRFQNVEVLESFNFNFFVSSIVGTALTGNLTFTNDNDVVSGSGTAFLTEVAAGDIIKSAGAHFQRVLSVTSDTSLKIDRRWGWATEAAVAARNIPANSQNRIVNCNFHGNNNNDNVGLGLFDDSLIEGCISHDSTGYGFGPDHTNRLKFIGNTCYDNPNSGIGMETCGDCVIDDNVFYGNNNGIYMISGTYRCIVTHNQCRRNQNGISVSYNSTSFPYPDDNTISHNHCVANTGHGIRVGGAHRTTLEGNKCLNNVSSGIVVTSDNGRTPDVTYLELNHAYDRQNTKTQQKGIWINVATNTTLVNNYAPDSGASQALSGVLLSVGAVSTTMINTDGVNPIRTYAQGNVTGATTFDRLNGDHITATMTGNVTATLTSGRSVGDELTLELTQDATGSRTMSWPSNFKKAGGTLTLSTGAAAVDMIKMRWNGTNWMEVARSLNVS